MKTAYTFHPDHKQGEQEAIVRAVIPRFAEAEMLILFGSLARGYWVDDIYT